MLLKIYEYLCCRLQFRNLVRLHNVDLCFTPMIVADSFCRSEQARQNEFTTESGMIFFFFKFV